MEWQPIETAPKNGRGAFWAAAAYEVHGSGAMEPVYVDFYGDWRNLYTKQVIAWKPTHWMPLPPPPTTTETDR